MHSCYMALVTCLLSSLLTSFHQLSALDNSEKAGALRMLTKSHALHSS